MLTNLHIQNFAIIDAIDIDFKKGLTVITGETGAGKSLIIDAISLLIGSRSSSTVVRSDASKAIIEGTFEGLNDEIYQTLNELDIDTFDDTIVLRRDIYANGKSVFRINGVSVSLNDIVKVSLNLVDIHIQNDNLRLFNPKNYLSFIDDSIIIDLVKDYQKCLNEYLLKLKKYQNLINKKEEITNNIDFLSFQLEELKKANLKVGEVENLEEELKYLNNYEVIYQNLHNIKEIIKDNNIRENLYLILDYLKKLKQLSPNYLETFETIENAYYNLEDLENTVSSDLNHLEFDENRLNEINVRLNDLNRLMRKYHRNIDELISFKDDLAKEIDNVENFDVYLVDLEKEIKILFIDLKNKAIEISNKRKISAANLKEDILITLKDLLLDKVQLEFKFEQNEFNDHFDSSVFTKAGIDNVDILISFNPGEMLKPLSKTASGGEMSRVMLAIKKHLFVNKGLSTVIFDEIDTGVSGLAANGVAKKLSEMSKSMQVFSITHLPIVASFADQHLFVSKDVIDGKTLTKVEELSFDERINVLAEMISPSDETGKAKEVAKSMILKK